MVKIGLHGVPRSGTSWLGQILNSSQNVLYKFQPLFSYELKGFLNGESSRAEVDRFFELLQTTPSDFLDQVPGKNKGIVPEFSKLEITHQIYKEVRYHHLIEHILNVHPGVKMIGIVRNPLAVLTSWFASAREFRRDLGWNEMEEWQDASRKNENRVEEFFGYNKWKEVTLMFERLQKKFGDRFYLVNYSDLLRNTVDEVHKLFHFCELELLPQTELFIDQSRSVEMTDTYAVFKTKQRDDAWKQSLLPEIIQAVMLDLDNSPLKKYLDS